MLLLLVACSSKSPQSDIFYSYHEIEKLPLENEINLIDLGIYRTEGVLVDQENVLVITRDKDGLLKLIDKNEKKMIKTLGRRGGGPGEFEDIIPSLTISKIKDTLVVYDPYVDRVDIFKLKNKEFEYISTKYLTLPKFYSIYQARTSFYGPSPLVAISTKSFFAQLPYSSMTDASNSIHLTQAWINNENVHFDSLIDYEVNNKVDDRTYNGYNAIIATYNYDKNKIVVASCFNDEIKVFDVFNGKVTKKYLKARYSKNINDISSFDFKSTNVFRMPTQPIVSKGEFIFSRYHNRLQAQVNKEPESYSIIDQFNIKGQPIKRIQVDVNVKHFDYCDKQNELTILTDDEKLYTVKL